MHHPTSTHWSCVKRLLRYLVGTIMHGLFLHKKLPINMHAYSDADWARNPDDKSFTSAHIVFLGHNPIAWSSKKQKSIVRSSIEAKYRAMVSIASKVLWVKSFFFLELDVSISSSSLIYCDNMGAIYLCANPVFRNAIDFHFVGNKVQSRELRVSCVNHGSTCRCSNKQSPYLLHEFKPLSSIRVQALYSRRV